MTPDAIRLLLADGKMNQRELAERLGVALRTVRHWLKGDREPGGAAVASMLRMRAEINKNNSAKSPK